jgi:hypothetical protein
MRKYPYPGSPGMTVERSTSEKEGSTSGSGSASVANSARLTRRIHSVSSSSPSPRAASGAASLVGPSSGRYATYHGDVNRCTRPRLTHVSVTSSSSGRPLLPSHRNVSASTPRAHSAHSLLPARLAASSRTARSIGTPFQWVTVTPGRTSCPNGS